MAIWLILVLKATNSVNSIPPPPNPAEGIIRIDKEIIRNNYKNILVAASVTWAPCKQLNTVSQKNKLN